MKIAEDEPRVACLADLFVGKMWLTHCRVKIGVPMSNRVLIFSSVRI